MCATMRENSLVFSERIIWSSWCLLFLYRLALLVYGCGRLLWEVLFGKPSSPQPPFWQLLNHWPNSRTKSNERAKYLRVGACSITVYESSQYR